MMKTFSINKEVDLEVAKKTEKLLSYENNIVKPISATRDDKKDEWIYSAFINLYSNKTKKADVNFVAYALKSMKFERIQLENSQDKGFATQDDIDSGIASFGKMVMEEHISDPYQNVEYSLVARENWKELQEFADEVFKEEGVNVERLYYLMTTKNDKIARAKFWKLLELKGKQTLIEEIRESIELRK